MAEIKTTRIGKENTKTPTLSGSLSAQTVSGSLGTKTISTRIGAQGVVALKDHAKLSNLEYAKSGHTGFAGILLDTTANWNQKLDYRPPEGMLIVYVDYQSYEDEHGDIVYVPGFKIGDGNAYLIDKPFVGEADSKLLQEHLEDTGLHIQPGEREFWNNKLNYVEPDNDLLIFTRD